jgi:hypothetical protein
METAVEKKQAGTLIGAYLVNGTVGNVGVPGAPIMHFSLVVVPSANSVSGTVEITQALASPYGSVVVKNVTGTIRATGFGGVTKVVALEGVYYHSLTPPAIGTITENFTAHMAIDDKWDGRGGFSYGNNHIENAPVHGK